MERPSPEDMASLGQIIFCRSAPRYPDPAELFPLSSKPLGAACGFADVIAVVLTSGGVGGSAGGGLGGGSGGSDPLDAPHQSCRRPN